MDKDLQQLKEMIESSRRIAFFGGAGLSTESGIPDFRSEKGIYAAKTEFGYPPETLLSHDFFFRHTDVFYQYYRKFLLYPDARPNAAHIALAALERQGRLSAVITQNIDGLHQAAGSNNVLELHGTVHKNRCTKCGKFYTYADILRSTGVPRCVCGGVVKPEVVLYGEGLDEDVLTRAIRHIAEADMLLIGGTSLVVYPAAGLVNYFSGSKLAVVNLSETGQDDAAALVIRRPIGEVLHAVVGDVTD